MARAPDHDDPADLVDEGRLEEAREAYEAALRAAPHDLGLLFEAADLYLSVLQDEDGDRELAERGLELARIGTKRARKVGDRDRELDFAWLEGVALNQLGESREALVRLAAAEKLAPDAIDVHTEKAWALYELCRFDEARAALHRAEALSPDEAWTQHQLGLLAERRGDGEEARRRFARARSLDPEAYPRPVALSQKEFDAAVEAALAELPEQVRAYLSNVAITVEDLPTESDLLASDPPLSPSILGLFRGAPYGQKASSDPWSHFPSSIVLYQRNLERFVRTRKELVEEIGVTLVHEVGHFLGLDEDELYQRGLD